MSEELKFCKDCKHYAKRLIPCGPDCLAEEVCLKTEIVTTCLVYGYKTYKYISCLTMRNSTDDNACGPEGKMFEPKPAIRSNDKLGLFDWLFGK